jgi:hypothetical protein
LIIVGANIGIITFILSHKVKQQANNLSTVVTDPSQLGKIGTTEGPAGQNVSLVVTPNAQFKGPVTIDKTLQVGDKLAAPNASIATLQAGNSSITALNVSGGTSLTDASLRGNLNVSGITNLQGAVTVAKILTASALNVVGNLTVGGSFTTNNFSARSLTSISTLTIGGHVVTAGGQPGWSRGSNLRVTDSVALSGNDASGTVSFNVGSNASNTGDIIDVAFTTAYTATPHISITPIGAECALSNPYIYAKSRTGFSIGVIGHANSNNSLLGYSCSFDYEIMQ